MITAVDTNVLLDVLIPGAIHGDASESALGEALSGGATVISEAVYTELAAHFPSHEELRRFLDDTGIRLQVSGVEVLHLAGRTWRSYIELRSQSLACPSCGASQEVCCTSCGAPVAPRQHVLADFLIGAHAAIHADRLLSRDRGYYRTYFPELQTE